MSCVAVCRTAQPSLGSGSPWHRQKRAADLESWIWSLGFKGFGVTHFHDALADLWQRFRRIVGLGAEGLRV